MADEAAFKDAIAGPGAVVVDWYAPWCGKCRQIAPTVKKLQLEQPNIRFVKVDTDAMPELAKKHGAAALPTFTFYKAGKEALPLITGYKKGPLIAAVEKLASTVSYD